ncbi:MAG: hypothetical protein J6P03_03380 [Opitutales bacterium]|nr:hypothetical protein [Opitutales bacterium]
MTIYQQVLAKTGIPAQLKKMREECEELIQAIDAARGKITPEVAEELADVAIVAGVINASFYAPAIAAARRYKERRMRAFLRSGFKTWGQFKKRAYPGFAAKKDDMLAAVAAKIKAATAQKKGGK